MHSFHVGRLFGIELRVDWSIVVIFWLLTWELAALALPTIAPSYPVGEYWAVAVVATVLFIVSLATHEMSHSVTARHRGIEVRDITLWMLGGIATIEGTPKTPRDELAIAVAGPAASAAIGGGGLVLGAALAALSAPRIIIAALVWIAMINLFLAAFNLAPAAPLDGGRVLRAWLWHRSGDRVAATIKAARAGRVFAWMLIAIGFAEFAAGGSVGGLWLIVVGWFVFNAARSEERDEELERDLGGVRVRDVMSPHPITAPDSQSIAGLVDDFVSHSRGSAVPVIGTDGRVSGLLTLSRCKLVPDARRRSTVAREIAEPIDRVAKAAPDDLLLEALRRGGGGEPRLLVFEGELLVGIVTPTDVMRVIQRAPLRPRELASNAA